MSTLPPGWLDIHGHFSVPRPQSEDADLVQAYRNAYFLVSEAPRFDAETTLAYNDRAGITMQMLSNLPPSTDALRASNDYGSLIVSQHPSRFGLLAGLPTDEPDEAVYEVKRLRDEQPDGIVTPDGFAVTTDRNGTGLGNPRLRPLWEELNTRQEVIFVHPNAYAPGRDGRPTALIEVAFDTARTITDMIYNRVFLTFPKITWVFAHSGGAFPAISGRLALLGAQPWVPNEAGVTKDEIKEQLRRIYVDTAATAESGMEPAIKMAGIAHVIYGSDCSVPCSTEVTLEENREAVKAISTKVSGDGEFVGMNGFDLFPRAKARAAGTL